MDPAEAGAVQPNEAHKRQESRLEPEEGSRGRWKGGRVLLGPWSSGAAPGPSCSLAAPGRKCQPLAPEWEPAGGGGRAGCHPGRREHREPESSLWPESDLRIIQQEGAMELNAKEQSSSPQKQGVKARSKSTEEIQPAKKAFQTSQKSLPNQMDGDESKGSCPVPAPSSTQQEQQQQT